MKKGCGPRVSDFVLDALLKHLYTQVDTRYDELATGCRSNEVDRTCGGCCAAAKEFETKFFQHFSGWFNSWTIKTVATRCRISKLKCTKFDFPRWGSLQRSPRQLDLRGLLLRGRREGEGKGREKGGEGKGLTGWKGQWKGIGRKGVRVEGVEGEGVYIAWTDL